MQIAPASMIFDGGWMIVRVVDWLGSLVSFSSFRSFVR